MGRCWGAEAAEYRVIRDKRKAARHLWIGSTDDWTPDKGARFEVHFEKARGFSGFGAKPFVAGLGDGVWTVADLEDAEGARVLQMACNGMSVREIADEMGTSKSTVGRMLTRAREAAVVAQPA